MREIGSEFWIQHKPILTENTGCCAYLLSGRSAIQFIIDDICTTRTVRKVLMPSYCCESMLLPFIRSGIEVQFYDVNRDSVNYPYNNDADIVFLIDFFGFIIPENAVIAHHEKRAGKTVIYDSTHKIDGNPEIEPWIDYSFCSFRKWFYCNFAKVTKYNGALYRIGLKTPPEAYLALRDAAALKKEQYMGGRPADKRAFLHEFQCAEQMLDEMDDVYSGVPVDFDISVMVSKRRENAAYLLEAMAAVPGITLWRENLEDVDVPMFVPVLVDPGVRGDLRGHLIAKQIYCPVHWPRSGYHSRNDELYDSELSLVCDQRYNISDMERMASAVINYMKG